MSVCVGIDSCPGGWVMIVDAVVRTFATFDDALATLPADAVIAVDMPIGLLDRGMRAADQAVKAFLGKRAASLFAIPPRAVLAETTYVTACRRSLALTGKKISLQAFHLFPKLREVDRHRADARLAEVHPETSFAVMAGAPLLASKKTVAGAAIRRRLLRDAGIVLPHGRVWASLTPRPRLDDVLDAAAAAWTARRIAAGTTRCFPDVATQYDGARSVVIVA